MKKILELFAGARCIGEAAEKQGHEVFSVDWENYESINLSKDIEFLTAADVPFIPDHIHASFDCTTYTIAASIGLTMSTLMITIHIFLKII